ncbi:C13 family peptidase [Tahibacter caeni]|uniref:C13 family peptidase n=1 Tax=Tahibacter caeni TaxID=1453545 RepID=UPI0021496EB9|nr:C13 family peptidase [Tahibacter caeni]
MPGRRSALPLLTLLLGAALGYGVRDRLVATPGAGAPAAATAAAEADTEVLRRNLAETRAWLARWLPGEAEPAETEEPDYSAERVFYDQYRLVDEALARLRPQTPGKADLYVVAFAGDGDENVFRNEAEYVEKLFSERFDARDRVVVLENNPATVETRPLATWSNLELVLDGLIDKARFDPDEDVLLLFLTSHGDAEHNLYVGMDVLPLDWIGAPDLAGILNARPFRWRVAIVSACYSGGFLDVLRNSTSMVITAARADRTSFGCGSASDITFFGKAFFVEGLNQTDSFRGAFEVARQLVAEWEEAEKQTPSEPQIASTPLIETKLAQWRQGIRLGPPQPFQPAVAGPSDAASPGAAASSEKSTKQ